MLTSSATDAKNVVKEGVVYKKGEGFMSGWKERYLILYTDKRLSYFIIDGLDHKGSIFITNIAPSNISESNKGNKSDGANYGFFIQTLNRKWEFAVKSFKERDDWIKKIRFTIAGKFEPQLVNNNSKPKPKTQLQNPQNSFDINKSMPLPNVARQRSNNNVNNKTNSSNNNNNNNNQQTQPNNNQKLVVHNRNSSKSAFANPNQYYNQYTQPQQQSQQQSQPQQQSQQQQQQYNNYNYGQQYNNKQYNQQQYNNKHMYPQQATHHASFSKNGYNNYYQQQQQKPQQPPPAWNTYNNNSGSMNNESQKQSNKMYKRSIKESVYTGFKIRKYDNSTRFSHLCCGYIRNCMDIKFPLKLQNLCQEYLGYFLKECLIPFKDSQLLITEELKIKMLKLLCNGMNKYFLNKIDLIYRGSKHGLTAKSFHKMCDGHAKTLVLLYTNYGNICGGYTNIAWSKDNKYHQDKNSFLFVFSNNKQEFQLFKIKESEYKHAVLHYKEYGPTWGYGHDLAVFSLTENNLNTQSCHSSYSFTSHELIGGWMYCKVTECEVFKIYIT